MTWVLSKHTHIDSTIGSFIPAESSSYVWLSHLCRGRGIATSSDAVCIPHPLTTDGLLPLIEAITVTTKHNSPAALMLLGSACMSLHYNTIIEINGECPAPLICGNARTGKSLVRLCLYWDATKAASIPEVHERSVLYFWESQHSLSEKTTLKKLIRLVNWW